MEKTYTIHATFGDHSYTLTISGKFQDESRHNPYHFESLVDAEIAFDNLDDVEMIRQGWKGFHVITVCLDETTIDENDEVIVKEISSKKITVDTLEKA